MQPPKFAIGQSIYLTHHLHTAYLVKDRYWDFDRETWRYKLGPHPTWFVEASLLSALEVEEILAEEPVVDEDDDEDLGYDSYDGDTGRALINGQWQVVDSDQWDRFQHS